MARVRNKARSRNRARLRELLFGVLGDRCVLCFSTEELEVDHVDGCTWRHTGVNAETRLYRYLRELREGVRLRLLCRSCNGSQNQYVHGTREERAEEVPF